MVSAAPISHTSGTIMNEERVNLLAYWIMERERIRVLKESGAPQPWTKDHILANFRFCNVRREDDKVTRWIAHYWRIPYSSSPNLTAAMVLARLLNNPDTLAKVGFPEEWDSKKILEGINHQRNGYGKWLNPAYVVTTCGVAMDKAEYIVNLATAVQESKVRPTMGDSLEWFHGTLMQFKGLGTFLAAQVVADLKNTPYNPLKSALDFMTWAAVGPGSLRGLRYVTGIPDLPGGQFLTVAQKLYAEIKELIDLPPIHMQDFQNCLCEFSKYWKAHAGIGQPKQRYHG